MKFIFVFVLLLLSGCAAPSELLVNDRGNTIRCYASGFGILGVTTAYKSVSSCVSDYEKLGYKKLHSKE